MTTFMARGEGDLVEVYESGRRLSWMSSDAVDALLCATLAPMGTPRRRPLRQRVAQRIDRRLSAIKQWAHDAMFGDGWSCGGCC